MGCMELRGLTGDERRHREELRLLAARWFAEGVPQAEVARRLEVSRQAVHKWHEAWRAGGADALRSAGPCGGPSYVTGAEFERVAAVLAAGPQASGFPGQGWTLARIGRVITEITGAVYARPAALRGLAFSGQASDRLFHAAIRNFSYSAWTSRGGR
jgi:putative transposase